MDKKVTPFFATLLEGQKFPNVKTDVKAGKGKPGSGGGPPLQTMKWPSDDDEDPIGVEI